MATIAEKPSTSERSLRRLHVRHTILLLLPALLLLVVFFFGPYLYLLYVSFMTQTKGATYVRAFTFDNYLQTVRDPFNWRIIWQTLRLGFVTTALTLVLSYPLAYHMSRASSRIKGLLMIMLLSPLLVGIVIRSYGWMILLADNGLINQAVRGIGFRELHLMYTPDRRLDWPRAHLLDVHGAVACRFVTGYRPGYRARLAFSGRFDMDNFLACDVAFKPARSRVGDRSGLCSDH